MRRGTLILKNLRMVILDEADEMLNMGFRDDIETLLKDVPPTRQMALFSATVPRAIEELISRYTKDPARIRMESATLTVPTVEQVCFEVDRRWKFEALTRLIDHHDITLGIIFANTQRDVVELSDHLVAAGYGAESIHGGMPQNARERVMQKFRRRQTELLVATDVAARGIDVDDIQAVINFDLPYDPEDYVHRIGRTGRAGRHGLALSLMSGREVFLVRDIERLTRQRLRRGQIPTIGEIEDAKQNQCLRDVRETLKAGDFRHYDHLLEVLLEEGFDSLDVASALIHHLFARAKAAQAAGKPEKPEKPGAAAGAAPRSAGPVEERPRVVRKVPTPAARPVREARPSPVTPKAPVASSAAPASPGIAPDSASALTDETPAGEAPAAIAPAAAAEGAPPVVASAPKPAAPRPAGPFARPAQPPRPVAPARPARPTFPGSTGSFDPRAERPARPMAPPAPPRAPRPPAAPPKPPVSPEELAAGPVEAVSEFTRLWMSIGEEQGITPETLRDFILGSTGEPAESIRHVDVRPRHSFADVPTARAAAVLGQLKRAPFGEHRLKVKIA